MMIVIGFILAVLLVGLDQLSKVLISTAALGWPDGEIVIIKGLFNFTSTYNTGAAFSIFREHPAFLAVLSVLAVIAITYFMKDFSFKRRPLYSISILLIYSGTIGNMIDRVFSNKGVFDFIKLTFMDFAIFNVADCYLTVGMVLLAIYILFFESKDPINFWPFNKKATKEEKTSDSSDTSKEKCEE